MADSKSKVAEETEADEPKVKFTVVKSTLPAKPDGGFPVALYERNAKHPNEGFAFVAGDKPVRVAVTPEVSRLLRDDVLVGVAEEKPKA